MKSSLVSQAIGVAVVGVALGAGAFAYKHFGKPAFVDTPCGKGTVSLLASLKSPVNVTLYATPGTPKIDRFIKSVSATMNDLAAASSGKLVFKVALVTSDDAVHEARERGLQEFAATASSDPMGGITRAFCGFGFMYGSERDAIPMIDPDNEAALPFWVVTKVREIRARADDLKVRFGVVSSKGGVSFTEPSLVARGAAGVSPTMSGIFAQAMPFYKLEDLDLHGGDSEIDSSYSGLFLLQPDSDYTDKELRRVDEFLMRGKKSLVVIASAVNVKASDPKMTPVLSAHNLDKLLDGYGIELQKDLLEDWAQPTTFPITTAAAQTIQIRAPSVLQVKADPGASPDAQALDTTFIPFLRMDELAFPLSSSLVLHPEKQPSATLRAVARSSATTTSQTTAPASLSPMAVPTPPADSETKRRILAAAVEGKLRSAFAGRPGDGVSAPAESPEASRVFVLSASQFVVNPLARAANPPLDPTAMLGIPQPPADADLSLLSQPYAQKYLTGTILALKNTMDWASLDESTVSCSAVLMDSTKVKDGKDK